MAITTKPTRRIRRTTKLGARLPESYTEARTDWFPTPAQPPVRPGEYETRYDASYAAQTSFARRYWDGAQWLFWSLWHKQWVPSTLDEQINAEWRGLAADPNA